MRAEINLFARRRGVCSGKNSVGLQMVAMVKVGSQRNERQMVRTKVPPLGRYTE